jgi:hypothetical protein
MMVVATASAPKKQEIGGKTVSCSKEKEEA